MDLSTAKAIVTGGASGLGLATAHAVVDAGGSVALFDVNTEQGEAAAARLGCYALGMAIGRGAKSKRGEAMRPLSEAQLEQVCGSGEAPMPGAANNPLFEQDAIQTDNPPWNEASAAAGEIAANPIYDDPNAQFANPLYAGA